MLAQAKLSMTVCASFPGRGKKEEKKDEEKVTEKRDPNDCMGAGENLVCRPIFNVAEGPCITCSGFAAQPWASSYAKAPLSI